MQAGPAILRASESLEMANFGQSLDQRSHEPEQQGQQQGRDVLAVDVGIRHQHDLVIAQLADVEVLVDAGAEGR